MSVRFYPVEEITDPLRVSIGLSGGSGTGKTFTALLIAAGMADEMTGERGARFGVADTENKRALHYKSTFPQMMHHDMRAVDDSGNMLGFGPQRWIDVIDAVEDAGLPVAVLDSFSHEWEGVGGILDMHATTLQRLTGGNDALADKRSQLAWAEVKPQHRRLVDRIVRANCNIIVCTRAKPVMQTGFGANAKNARKTKTRREDVPWDPASDGDLMFEMTAMMILDPSAPGCPVHQIKCADQFKGLFDPRRPMDRETGRAMAKWAKGAEDAQRAKEAMDKAREFARKGKEEFVRWWNSDDGKNARHMVNPIIGELQGIVAQADELAQRNPNDPFDGMGPTKEQLEAEAEKARKDFEAERERELAEAGKE